MRSCLLQEVWTSSGTEILLPSSPVAELGSVIHKLFEVAGRGQLIEASKEKVDETWARLIMEAEDRMLKSHVRKLLVPLSKSIPDFEVRRLRACRRAVQIAQEIRCSPLKFNDDSSGCTGFELWIETNDGAVGGYIDHIKRTDQGIVLVDYKSGAVLERDSGGTRVVKEAYKDQMELYAALYHYKFGEWPVDLEIVRLEGAVMKLEWEPVGAEQLLASARRLIQDVNMKIAEVQSGKIGATSLASPNARGCGVCLFRPGCQAYWTVREHDLTQRWPHDIRGILKEKIALRNGTFCLRITKDLSSTDEVASIRNISNSPQRHPLLLSLQAGSHLAVYCLRYLHGSKDYAETQSSVIYQTD